VERWGAWGRVCNCKELIELCSYGGVVELMRGWGVGSLVVLVPVVWGMGIC